ncbi:MULTISPECIES: hypothetical protein [Cysteiniphilum]|uniref:Uncharacterized protein n=1 Tax=Cysteiniphilum litorale TaxID=2056700 RepID=A0A8J2Z348_9GAMM|nr:MULTISPECIES: hypothetical protein [Cysteiniphilum]GGF92135.1 hypothetical protein GCM10010995_06650 [Cysteiniphilum litorale]
MLQTMLHKVTQYCSNEKIGASPEDIIKNLYHFDPICFPTIIIECLKLVSFGFLIAAIVCYGVLNLFGATSYLATYTLIFFALIAMVIFIIRHLLILTNRIHLAKLDIELSANQYQTLNQEIEKDQTLRHALQKVITKYFDADNKNRYVYKSWLIDIYKDAINQKFSVDMNATLTELNKDDNHKDSCKAHLFGKIEN